MDLVQPGDLARLPLLRLLLPGRLSECHWQVLDLGRQAQQRRQRLRPKRDSDLQARPAQPVHSALNSRLDKPMTNPLERRLRLAHLEPPLNPPPNPRIYQNLPWDLGHLRSQLLRQHNQPARSPHLGLLEERRGCKPRLQSNGNHRLELVRD